MVRSDIFRSGESEEAFKPPQDTLLDLPPQFTLDELSTELLNLMVKFSKGMALMTFAKQTTSVEEQDHILEECVIFYWWYLAQLIQGRTTIQERIHIEFRDFLREWQRVRRHVRHYKTKSKIRHQQYDAIFLEAAGSAKFAENFTPILVEIILCGDELCVWTPSIQTGITDCIQVFARLIVQVLSVPMTHGVTCEGSNLSN